MFAARSLLEAIGGNVRAAFVVGTAVLALALGVGAAISDSRLFVVIATMGMASLIWGAAHLVERLTGRDLWHFSPPYPYRSMQIERGRFAAVLWTHGRPPPAARRVARFPAG
jgi:hypothetical protein